MVTAFGMSEMGPWALMEPAAQSGYVVLRMLAWNSVSENLAADIDDQAYDVAKEHVRSQEEPRGHLLAGGRAHASWRRRRSPAPTELVTA